MLQNLLNAHYQAAYYKRCERKNEIKIGDYIVYIFNIIDDGDKCIWIGPVNESDREDQCESCEVVGDVCVSKT